MQVYIVRNRTPKKRSPSGLSERTAALQEQLLESITDKVPYWYSIHLKKVEKDEDAAASTDESPSAPVWTVIEYKEVSINARLVSEDGPSATAPSENMVYTRTIEPRFLSICCGKIDMMHPVVDASLTNFVLDYAKTQLDLQKERVQEAAAAAAITHVTY